MPHTVKIKAYGVNEITQCIINIKPGQEVAYGSSGDVSMLNLSAKGKKEVCYQAHTAEKTGKAMLFHRRVKGTNIFLHVIRGVEPSAKNTVESAAAMLPRTYEPPKWG